MRVPAEYKICSAQDCRSLDAYTINDLGIPGFTLMEIAGSKTAGHLMKDIEPGSHGLFLCGKGNNAGDALVVARHLFRNDISSDIVFISGTEKLSSDAQTNFDLLKKLVKTSHTGSASISFIEKWPDDVSLFSDFDFIIDGMLGTGLDSEIRGDYLKAILWANDSLLPVYSIDIPTGLHADSGRKLGNSIQAKKTFTFGARKTGFYFNDGPGSTGEVVFCDLGFPPVDVSEEQRYVIDETWVRKQPVPHHSPRHKYEAGVLYIIAGSEGLTGAAILAAKSAWAEGLGAVILIVPKGLSPIFETNLIQEVKHPVGTPEDRFFKPEHITEIIDILKNRKGKVLLGPGLGRNGETLDFVRRLLSNIEDDLIIDADGLWCLSQINDWKAKRSHNWILTPHPGELYQLTGKDVGDPFQRLRIAEDFSRAHQVTVISKGMPTTVCSPEGESFVTNYDTTIFARTGYGDVLAGKVAANLTLEYESKLSCIIALLDGKHKHEQALKRNPIRVPEPFDLI